MGVEAPLIARKVRAGQFLMLRSPREGERIPLTFSDWSPEEGWIRFIYMRVGKTTHQLSHLEVGDALADVVGPLGVPTHVEDWDGSLSSAAGWARRWPTRSRVRWPRPATRSTSSWARARRSLLVLEEEFAPCRSRRCTS
jgi:ferredoxin/flavodoxin---NADP+ reductase